MGRLFCSAFKKTDDDEDEDDRGTTAEPGLLFTPKRLAYRKDENEHD
jgi:hypothetical protein